MTDLDNYFAREARHYWIAQNFIARPMIIGIGFGLGWLLSKLAWSPESEWWLFWTPAAMLTAFAASGLIHDFLLPLPRPLIYLALLAAAIYYAYSESHKAPPQPPQMPSRRDAREPSSIWDNPIVIGPKDSVGGNP